jgi:hypothetical protein
VVANDYTIRYNNQQYQITRRDIHPGLRGAKVRVERRRDETVWVRFRGSYLNVQVCEAPGSSQPLPARPGEKRIPQAAPERKAWNWMQGF